MWSKIKKGVRYPTQILLKMDDLSGKIRGWFEYNSNANISFLAKIRNPEKVEIGDNSRLYPFSILKPKKGGITIGDNCTIHEFGFIAGDISIGDGVRIAQKVSIHSFDHTTDRDQKIWKQPLDLGRIVIQDDVWVGCNVTILKDVEVGEGAVIGAGSVVTDDIEPYTVVAGNPARPIDVRE
jgi:acetyltransferase-like isoleucine patch superfamily enzyme